MNGLIRVDLLTIVAIEPMVFQGRASVETMPTSLQPVVRYRVLKNGSRAHAFCCSAALIISSSPVFRSRTAVTCGVIALVS